MSCKRCLFWTKDIIACQLGPGPGPDLGLVPQPLLKETGQRHHQHGSGGGGEELAGVSQGVPRHSMGAGHRSYIPIGVVDFRVNDLLLLYSK